jgi:hypothetical protein
MNPGAWYVTFVSGLIGEEQLIERIAGSAGLGGDRMRTGSTDSWFLALQWIVEEKIRQAQKDGLFDNLPGKGKPLALDDDSRVDPALRTSFRILKNAGILPPEMQLRREIHDLRQMLEQVQDEDEAKDLIREINERILESNIVGSFSVHGGMDQVYAEKVLERIRSRKSRFYLEGQGRRKADYRSQNPKGRNRKPVTRS